MDRADRIGWWVSGAAHAGILGFAVLGGALFRPQPLEAVRMAEVSTMSEAEFQALAAAADALSAAVEAGGEQLPAAERRHADAVVASFGSSGPALVEALRGAARGRLPFDLPRSMAQVREHAPDRPGFDDPLLPRGHRWDPSA